MATNYTGNVTPSLSNAPASSWTDDAAKRSHVGNTYLVTGSGGTAGNVYAFEEYAAPLVKNASGLPADIVTLTDGGEDLPMVKAEVSLSPIQSLNGYDHPWAAGAGKNKFPYPVERDVTYSNVHFVSDGKGKITITGTASGNNDATFALTDYFVIPDGSQYELCFLNTEGKGIVQFLKDATVLDNWTLSSAYRHSSYVGMSNKECNRVKFIVTQGETYNQTLQIMFLLSSDVTNTYIPYSNLCPISGHTGATLNRTGKNLWKFNASYQSASSGTLISNQAYVLKAGTYTLSMKGSIGAATAVTFRDSGNNVIVTKTLYSASFVDGYCAAEIALTKQSAKLNIYSSGAYDISEIQLEVGATAHAYEEPTATAYTSSFGQTVYGGTFDFVSGKLVIDHVLYTDSGSAGWNRNENGSFFIWASPASSAEQTADGCYCNYAPYAVSFTGMNVFVRPTNSTISLGTGWGEIYATADELKAAFAQNPLQIVYKLATPIEIDLDPTEVQTLLGLNNVWASDGQISALTYQSNQFIPKYDWFETWNMPKITRNNGSVIVLPYPKEYTPEIHDVDAATTGRNAAGTMIRDRVAIKHKFNYVFPPLSQADATELLAATKDASFTLTTASPETGAKTNYRVYAGDKSLPVYWMPNHDTASWLYSSVSVNLIEM